MASMLRTARIVGEGRAGTIRPHREGMRRIRAGSTCAAMLLSCLAGWACRARPADSLRPLVPGDGAQEVRSSTELRVRIENPERRVLEVTFYGRSRPAPPPPFTFVVLPDTQYYAQSFPEAFIAQTRYIMEQRAALNVAGVIHVGDIVEVASDELQWQRASAAIEVLEQDPDLPFGLCVGNHDQDPDGDPEGTELYNRYFGAHRFEGLSWYGGHYGDDHDNFFILPSASGLDFVVLFLEYVKVSDPHVLEWADGVLKAHADRRAIICTHSALRGETWANTFTFQGRAQLNALADNPNLFLIVAGHYCETGRRTHRAGDRRIHVLLSDYQCRPEGGQGWLRLMKFVPGENRIEVRTYSPTLDRYLTGSSHAFDLSYPMDDCSPFEKLDSLTLADEETASTRWSGLAPGRVHEWRVGVTDGAETSMGPIWTFRTAHTLTKREHAAEPTP
jgi:hypothetical protein